MTLDEETIDYIVANYEIRAGDIGSAYQVECCRKRILLPREADPEQLVIGLIESFLKIHYEELRNTPRFDFEIKEEAKEIYEKRHDLLEHYSQQFVKRHFPIQETTQPYPGDLHELDKEVLLTLQDAEYSKLEKISHVNF